MFIRLRPNIYLDKPPETIFLINYMAIDKIFTGISSLCYRKRLYSQRFELCMNIEQVLGKQIFVRCLVCGPDSLIYGALYLFSDNLDLLKKVYRGILLDLHSCHK